MHVDLDHARIGRHREMQKIRIARRQIAFQHHLATEFAGDVLNHGDQRQPILGGIEPREEHVDDTVARLDAKRGAHHVGFAEVDHRRILRNRTEAIRSSAHKVGRRQGSAERLARRQLCVRRKRIGLGLVLDCFGIHPGQPIQRQPIADRRITGSRKTASPRKCHLPLCQMRTSSCTARRNGSAEPTGAPRP
jgi:hypothetical protein